MQEDQLPHMTERIYVHVMVWIRKINVVHDDVAIRKYVDACDHCGVLSCGRMRVCLLVIA